MARAAESSVALAGGFRFEPPLVALDRVVARPRLTQALRERFERRLTVVTGVAGYGKTTALALAIDANAMQPAGVDLWFGIDEFDIDPGRFLSGLASLVGVRSTRSVADGVEAIATEIWARAPDDVALIVDDVHLLAGSESAAILAALLRRLPANGHLVLAGRHLPELPLARLRAHGQVLEVGPDDLAFDEQELIALAGARPDRGIDTAALPRLPALADLHLSARIGVGADFLWEEILSSLPDERVETLLRASVLEEIDDELVLDLSDGRFTTDELLAGLPLVDTARSGRRRMHDLMRAALSERLAPDARAATAARAAALEADRGNFRAAVQLLADCEPARAVAIARRFVLMPTLRRTFADQTVVREIVERIEPGSVLARLLRLECRWGELSTNTHHRVLVDDLARLASAAGAAGDAEIEAIALFRAIQGSFLEKADASEYLPRMSELGETVPYAAQVVRYARAEQALYAGRPDESVAQLTATVVADRDVETVMSAGLLCSLGRPEEVGVDMMPGDLAQLPDGAELYFGLAMWMRGELPPELALPIAKEMCAVTVDRRVVHPSVSILGVASVIALAAGETAIAAANVGAAHALARWGCAPHIALHTQVAEAALACVEGSEREAAELLGRALAAVPLGHWPTRPYLLELPLLYIARPETRPVLDGCRFGGSLTVALGAARALVELRASGSTAPATALPWEEERLLRVHVLPPHLTELAAAAASAGDPVAAELLDRIPDARRHLRRLAGSGSLPAAASLAQMPTIPDERIGVRVLGPVEILRDGVPVDDPDWERRSRVRELMALLAHERRVPRTRAADLLWPDLAPDKAAGNLRVTLTYLQKVLEPDRDRATPPFFLRVLDSTLVLADEVSIDVDAFEGEMTRAMEHDRDGAPHAALACYESAVAHFRGDYLADLDAEWAAATRTRVRFLAVNAMCRLAELLIARGEPERAGSWALRAREMAPLNERAERLYVSCLLAAGDRAGAVSALRGLADGLAAEGLEPEAETMALHDRLTRLTAR